MPQPPPRPASTSDKIGSVKNVNDGLRGMLGFGGDMFLDRPGFINGEGGGWPLADVIRDLTRFNCRRWARADKEGFSPYVNATNAALCDPYLSSIGMGVPEGDMGPVHKGGQCDGVPYGARYSWKASEGDSPNNYTPSFGQFLNGSQTLYGPVTYHGRLLVGGGSTFCGNPGQSSFEASGFDAGGAPIRVALNQGGATCRPGSPTITGLSFERLDGGAECGNPPTLYTPPGNTTSGPTDGPNIVVNIPGIGPITVSVDPGEDGNPIVCYDELDLCVEIPIGDPGMGNGSESTGPGAPEAGGSGTTGDGGTEEGEAPSGTELWALKIDILAFPPSPKKYSADVYRGVCYVYMGDANGLDHDPAGAMLRDGQLVLAEREGLTKWRVTANVGYNLSVTPYYRETGE